MPMTLRRLAPLGGALLLALAACETAPTNNDSRSGTGVSNTGANTPTVAGIDRGNLRGPVGSTAALPFAEGADRVFFAYDRSELTPAARGTVSKWGAYLMADTGRNLMIEGHADERGTREYNLALGERRAAAVREYLLTLGVKPTQLKTASFGKERPAIAGSSEQAWSQNRRAVAVVN